MASFSDQMTSLVDAITTSRRDCILAVGNMKTQATDMMSGFAQAKADMARQLKSELAAGASARAHQVDSMRRANREEQRRAGSELRHALEQTTDRIAGAVASFKKSFARECASMARAQQTQFSRARKARAKDRAADSLACVGMLNGIVQSHQAMARQLRGTLSASAAANRGDTAEMKRGFNAAQGALRDDFQNARQIWRDRGPKGGPVNAAALRATVPGYLQELPKAFIPLAGHLTTAVAQAEPTVSRKPWGKLSDEEKVLRVVRKFPRGASATDIGEKVSLHAGVVGKIMKELMEQGEVHRDDSTRLYFPAKPEE